MKLELFNSTNMVKQVPKYNYTGNIRIPAQGVYPIEEYMMAFYRPYARIGVYVRSAEVLEEVEKEVEKVLSPSTLDQPVIEPESVKQEESISKVPEIQESDKAEEPTIETQEQPLEGVSTETEVKEEVKKYTEADLQELRVNELKDLAASMGIDLGDVKKKAPYIEAILTKQEV